MAGTTISKSLSTNAGGTDSSQRTSVANRDFDETSGWSETLLRLAGASRIFTDGAALQNPAKSLEATQEVELAEQVAGLSTPFTRTVDWGRSFADLLALADAATLQKIVGAAAFEILAAEALGLTETFSRLSAGNRSLVDTAAWATAFARLSAGNRSLVDTAAWATAFARLSDGKRSLVDTAAWATAFARLADGKRLLADTLALTDTAALVKVGGGVFVLGLIESLGLAQHVPSSLLTGLQHYWRLDEPSGTRADQLGGMPLSDNNTVTQAAGHVTATAAQFTAANSEHLSHVDDASLWGGDHDVTIAAWVYLDSITSQHQIIAKDDVGARDFELCYFDGDGLFLFGVFVGGSEVVVHASNFGTVTAGSWRLVIADHNATTDLIRIRVDNGAPNTQATGGALDARSVTALRVGSRVYPGFQNYWDGRIGPVMMWDRVLTDEEHSELWGFSPGAGVDYPFLAAFQRIADGKRALADPVAWTELFARSATGKRSLVDTLALVDATTLTKAGALVLAQVEALGLAQVFIRTATGKRTIADSMAFAEAVLRTATGKRSLTDTLALTDTAALVKVGAGVFTLALAEALGLTTPFARRADGNRILTDTLRLTDAVGRAGAALRAFVETTTLADVYARTSVGRRALAETVPLAEAVLRTATGKRSLTDTLALRDTAATHLVAFGVAVLALVERFGLLDGVTRRSDARRTLTDVLALVDAATAVAFALQGPFFVRGLIETAGAEVGRVETPGAGRGRLETPGVLVGALGE